MDDEAAFEIEALQSLMVDGELIVISDGSNGAAALKVVLVPNNSSSGSPSSKSNYVGATLSVKYTAKYPDELPEWKLEATRGLDPDMVRQLNELVKEEMQANVGMPMIFSVAEAMRSWLIANNSPPKSMYDEMESSKAAAAAAALESDGSQSDDPDLRAEECNQGRSHGLLEKDLSELSQRITKVQFDQWLVELRKDAILKGDLEQKLQDKLSGRQLFEMDSSLISSDAVAGDALEDDVVDMTTREDLNSLEWQNANLFVDDGGVDEGEIEW
eukprot:Lankesteria_metandrocarpae@DN4888_c0_g1_i1.p1